MKTNIKTTTISGSGVSAGCRPNPANEKCSFLQKTATPRWARLKPLALLALTLMTGAQSLFAQLNVPSDGSDGVLNITSNTVIDLSQAVTGTWSDDNTTNSGKGVYDPAKWAVVFKYQSVNIATNCTVTFANHPSHAPVVWLVQSNAVVNGTVSVNGHDFDPFYPDYLLPVEPGPGGFRGGCYSGSAYGSGYGPGGSNGGGTQSQASSYGAGYGGPTVMPLIGGSGGASTYNPNLGWVPIAGPGGGGAILIAANVLTINGAISALAGNGFYHFSYYDGTFYDYAGDGAIRVVANQVLGTGILNAGNGRNKTDANYVSAQLVETPNTIAVAPGLNPNIFPPDSDPVVSVLSVNGQTAPVDPVATVSNATDMNMGTNSPVDVIIMSKNFPPNGAVSLRVVPKYGNNFNVSASFVGGTFSNATWKATTTLPNGFCVLQAHATSP